MILYFFDFFFQMTENPWNVDSIQAFVFLKCPECIFDTKLEENFLEHAFGNHPNSSIFFDKRLKQEDEREECDIDEQFGDETKNQNTFEALNNCDNSKSEKSDLLRG